MTIEQGIAHQQAGRLSEAESIYRGILSEQPNHADALHLLGTIALACEQWTAARDLSTQAIELCPEFADYHCTLADALWGLGQLDEAAGLIDVPFNSVRVFLRHITISVWHYLKVDAAEEAAAAYREILKQQPDCLAALCNLSQALLVLGQTTDALKFARAALSHSPNLADAHNNVGAALLKQGRIDEALESFDRAVVCREDFPLAHMNRGMALLSKGDYVQGWEEYDWRLKLAGTFRFRQSLARPPWKGEELSGKTILLHSEQGFGDTIQFARYIPLVKDRGARVIVGCQPELKRLLNGMSQIKECVVSDDPLPEFDLHCPLPSLPKMFQTRLETIPANVPYLKVDSTVWQKRLEGYVGLQVGLVWSGRKSAGNDLSRAIRLNDLSPLMRMDGIQFHSLQVGEASREIQQNPLIDWSGELKDFVDTAGLIDNLDLLITIDTAAAHLAGAMGKKVWLLLPFAADWRWLREREDSPWYPTMRLFRQSGPNDWTTPIDRMARELKEQL